MADLTPETLREDAELLRTTANWFGAESAGACCDRAADILDGIAAMTEQRGELVPIRQAWCVVSDDVVQHPSTSPAAALIALGRQSKEKGNA